MGKNKAQAPTLPRVRYVVFQFNTTLLGLDGSKRQILSDLDDLIRPYVRKVELEARVWGIWILRNTSQRQIL